MSVPEFVAALLGPYFLAVGLAILVDNAGFRSMVADFTANRSLVFFAGLIALAIGAALVKVHNVWVVDWPVLVTLLGWLSLIGGAIRIIWPGLAIRIAKRMTASSTALNVGGVAAIAIGAMLVNIGFLG